MKLWSNSWENGGRIPSRYAAGGRNAQGKVGFSDNLNPHLAWNEPPPGTRSFTLICHDFDVPSRGDDVNQHDREIPSDLERVDFFHWVIVDLPPTLREIAEGEFSRGFTLKGKQGPATLHGARQGVNDFTGMYAGDPQYAGQYFGYDGPYPPFNDSLVHHYVFTLYALSIDRACVEGAFTGQQVRQAINPYVLREATLSGTYTLNPRLAS